MQCIRMPVGVWKEWATLNSEHPYARFFLDTPYCDDGIAELRAQWMEKVSEWQENIQNCTSHARKTAPADSFGFVSVGQIDAHASLRLVDGNGRLMRNDFQSFDHFA